MSAPNDPADVFIGYSRRDGQTSPALFSTLLAPDSGIAGSFMKLNTRFYDARLEAGEDWGEELEKHAAGCKVFVALVGPGWIEVLKQRNEGEDGVEVTVEQRKVTDWVYKELELALERDNPAALQIVCINGAKFDTKLAETLFPSGNVRDTFRSSKVQVMDYQNDNDNGGFCQAIRSLLEAYHHPKTPVRNLMSTPSIVDTPDPRLRVFNRDGIWESSKNHHVAADCRFSIAISFAGDNKRDRVRQVAEILRDEVGDGRVFFDEWFEAEIAGHDANTVLQTIYQTSTQLVVTCVCKRYNEKPWTQDEWRAIQSFERTLRDAGTGNKKRLRFLPLRFGDGEVDGLFDTAMVPDVRERTPQQIADLILQRLRLSLTGNDTENADRENDTLKGPDETPPITQKPLAIDSGDKFTNKLCEQLTLALSHERLQGFVNALHQALELSSVSGRASVDEAAKRLINTEPATESLEEILRAYISLQRSEQCEIWEWVKDVFLLLLPRLIDPKWIDTQITKAGSDDLRMFEVAVPSSSPNLGVEVIMARLDSQRGGILFSAEGMTPASQINTQEDAIRLQSAPSAEIAIEQLGLFLTAKYDLDVPKQMKKEHWRKLDSQLRLRALGGEHAYYLVIPENDPTFASPDIIRRLYEYLPNLPRFLLMTAEDQASPLLCDPYDVDTLIMSLFKDLKPTINTADAETQE